MVHDRISRRVAVALARGLPSRAEGGCPFHDRIALRHQSPDEAGVCASCDDPTSLDLGNVLIMATRDELDFIALSPNQCSEILRKAHEVRARTDRHFHSDACKVGVHADVAGRQAIDHANDQSNHHANPRETPGSLGELLEPRGGTDLLTIEPARHWVDEHQGARQ